VGITLRQKATGENSSKAFLSLPIPIALNEKPPFRESGFEEKHIDISLPQSRSPFLITTKERPIIVVNCFL
jgi:hypothetical protein